VFETQKPLLGMPLIIPDAVKNNFDLLMISTTVLETRRGI